MLKKRGKSDDWRTYVDVWWRGMNLWLRILLLDFIQSFVEELSAAVDVLDVDAAMRDPPICRFLRTRMCPAARLLGGHDDLD